MDGSVQTIGGRRRGGSGHLVRSVTFCARAAMVGEELVKSGDAVGRPGPGGGQTGQPLQAPQTKGPQVCTMYIRIDIHLES